MPRSTDVADGRDPIRICFVCLGNICRSPTAEAVMRHLLAEEARSSAPPVEVQSAGTGDWHVGEPRDRRSRAVGERRGIPLLGRAQQFTAADFVRFDQVIAMDRQNLEDLTAMAPDAAARAKLSLLRAFEAQGEDREVQAARPRTGADLDVPDPYYGGEDGFDRVFDICLAACRGLLGHLRGLEPRMAGPAPPAAATTTLRKP